MPLNSQHIGKSQQGTFNQNGAGIQRKPTTGKLPTNIEPLSLDVDPHAWDLQPDEIDLHKLIQNFCEYHLDIELIETGKIVVEIQWNVIRKKGEDHES